MTAAHTLPALAHYKAEQSLINNDGAVDDQSCSSSSVTANITVVSLFTAGASALLVAAPAVYVRFCLSRSSTLTNSTHTHQQQQQQQPLPHLQHEPHTLHTLSTLQADAAAYDEALCAMRVQQQQRYVSDNHQRRCHSDRGKDAACT